MNRTIKDPDERRRELLAAAQQFFYTKGYENTTVNDIIDAVGVAKGTFYHYFASKEAALEAMVQELVVQLVALLRTVTRDETLTAPAKWVTAFRTINNWKVGQKEQLLAMARVMLRPENVRLYQKIRSTALPEIVAELSGVVRQGLAEGAFDTPHPDEAAGHCFAIMEVLSLALRDIMLAPEPHEDPLTLALQKVAAAEYAIEVLLGASRGSLPVIDRAVLEAWFR